MKDKSSYVSNIVFQMSYVFIYVRHFYFPTSVYAQNLSRILLVIYWCFSVCIFLLALNSDIVERNKSEEENVKLWTSVSNLSLTGKALKWSSWIMVLGFGVIGRWFYFVPLILSHLFELLWTSGCNTKLKNYRKAHNIPEPPPARKESNTSRYNIIKE